MLRSNLHAAEPVGAEGCGAKQHWPVGRDSCNESRETTLFSWLAVRKTVNGLDLGRERGKGLSEENPIRP